MYYITNQTGEIIAADIDLLKLVDVKEIGDLYKRVALGEVDFQLPSDTRLVLHKEGMTTEYTVKQSTLSSILGEITVVHILPQSAADTTEPAAETEDELFSLIEEKEEEASLPETEETPLLLTDEEDTLDLDNLLKETEESIVEETQLSEEALQIEDLDLGEEKHTVSETEEELFDLLLPDEAEERIEEITEAYEAPVAILTEENEEETTPILIDIHAISQKIGITPEDYNTFLNEYIDTAIHLEKDLQSSDTQTRQRAIKTLSHLSNVLHLPRINEIMETISSSDTLDQQSHIASLYATLSRLTTHQEKSESADESSLPETETVSIEPQEQTEEAAVEGFGTIDLSDVTPIHF